MEIKCNVIQDLLPLYVDNACSKESADMVTEHINTCPECKELYDKMCSLNKENILKREQMDIIAHHRRSFKKKRRILSLVCVVALIATLITSISISEPMRYGFNFIADRVQLIPTIISYGNSEVYSRKEMNVAIRLIKEDFKYDFAQLERRKLYSIKFTSDDYCKEVLLRENEHSPKNDKIIDCMVFTTSFKTSILGRHMILERDEFYSNYYYVIVKTKDGEWVKQGAGGFGPP
jgi:hypothetical protein